MSDSVPAGVSGRKSAIQNPLRVVRIRYEAACDTASDGTEKERKRVKGGRKGEITSQRKNYST